MKQNIFIVASGTGGHVIPAKNIACLLLDSNYLVTWIGTRHGIENKIVNDKRIDFKYLNSSGIRGKSLFNMIKGFLNLFRSLVQSIIHIKKGKPIFIIGFGGYISVPVSIAAFIMRVPVYVHESNSIAGTANRINNLLSKTTFQTFPETFSSSKKNIHSGNPIKDSFSNITQPDVKYMHGKETLNVLIFGGSQGSSFFNQTIPSCISKFGDKFKIKHISGNRDRLLVEETYSKNLISSDVMEFSHEMDLLYDWSDIVISRAGSMTLSEICKAGRAAILVPFLYATDKHQYFNAKFLEDNMAAFIVEENDSFAEELDKILSQLYNNQELLLKLSKNGKNLFPEDSSAIILKNIPELNEKLNNTISKK
tara:strand:- start:14323 stop:15420 length:1098 start_codon:yes stop_codon:yes gene_type:complete